MLRLKPVIELILKIYKHFHNFDFYTMIFITIILKLFPYSFKLVVSNITI